MLQSQPQVYVCYSHSHRCVLGGAVLLWREVWTSNVTVCVMCLCVCKGVPCKCAEAHMWVTYVTHMRMRPTWVTHMCAMSHSLVSVYMWVTYVTHMRLKPTWVTRMCAMSHSHVCHGSPTCVPWVVDMCTCKWLIISRSHVYMWVTYHTHANDMSHAHVCHKSLLTHSYGVATVSRIDKIIGLFCRISSLL